MVDFYDGEVKQLLGPNYSQDTEVQALSYAIQQGMQQLLDSVSKTLVYADTDAMDAVGIPLMVTENNVLQYNKIDDAEKKAWILKNAILLHNMSGATSVVQNLLDEVFDGDVCIQNWNEYNGDPYHFRIYFRRFVSASMSEDFFEYMSKIIESTVNVRSRTDGVYKLVQVSDPYVVRVKIKTVKCQTVTAQYKKVIVSGQVEGEVVTNPASS